MLTPRLVLVLGDQLSVDGAALRSADRRRDIVVMAEVLAEATSVPHHPKKIALIFTAMRKFAARLVADGWRVAYGRLDDPENAGSIPGELLRRADETGATEVIAIRPGDWRTLAAVTAARPCITTATDGARTCSQRKRRSQRAVFNPLGQQVESSSRTSLSHYTLKGLRAHARVCKATHKNRPSPSVAHSKRGQTPFLRFDQKRCLTPFRGSSLSKRCLTPFSRIG